jgi:hypothetical protein
VAVRTGVISLTCAVSSVFLQGCDPEADQCARAGGEVSPFSRLEVSH